jgi:putative SOS response-associated peptidase YedK
MCGRFTQSQRAEVIAKTFQVENVSTLEPRYNIAPTQSVATILQRGDKKTRQFKLLQWGLIPSWAKDTKISSKLINARAETVDEKPAFRNAFKHRRCLVIADGFYEWQSQEAKQRKQPFYCRMNNGGAFAFAGLWESWKDPNGEVTESCTLLTTDANELMRPIHHRMPVILSPEDYDLWLDPEVQESKVLQPLLRPYAADDMQVYAVSTKVNKAANDQAECILKR